MMEPFPELIRKAQNGDVSALKQIVVRFESLIKSECSKFGLWDLPELSHSDLFQEVTIQVLTKLDQFRGERENDQQASFESWLRTTTRRTVLNILRQHGNTVNRPSSPIISIDDELSAVNDRNQTTASWYFSKQEQDARIRQVIEENLDDECQQILRIRILEGGTYETIASQLGLHLIKSVTVLSRR